MWRVVGRILVLQVVVVTAPSPSLAATTLVVDSTVDSGDALPGDGNCVSQVGGCTVRAAIDEANALAAALGEVVITIPAGTFTLTLPGANEDHNASGDLDIRSHVILQGAGSTATVIDAAQIDRVLNVYCDFACASPFMVEVRDLTLTGGQAPTRQGGGGVANGGILTLTRVRVVGNRSGDGRDFAPPDTEAKNGGDGGGIYNSKELYVNDSVVANNATGRGGSDDFDYTYGSDAKNGGQGGGIFNASGRLAIIRDSSITSNRTGYGGTLYGTRPRTAGAGGSGGGIHNDGMLELYSSVVSGNWTGRGGAVDLTSYPGSPELLCWDNPSDKSDPTTNRCPSGFGGDGGGIASRLDSGSTSITDSAIAGNWTGRAGIYCSECVPGGAGDGGGLGSSLDPTVTVNRSTFAGNITGRDPSGSQSDKGHGGGVSLRGGNLTITSSTFSGNHAYLGGGLYAARLVGSVRDSTFTSNHASLRGGGIDWIGFLDFGYRLELGNTIVAGNGASEGPDCWTIDPGDPGERIQSLGYNLIGSTSECGLEALLSDQLGGTALIGPLTDNGGPTLTHEPQPGSDAIDDGGNCLDTDQRGQVRPLGGACDVGSVEVGVLAPTVATGDATLVTETSATLNGAADPNGAATTAAFDFGTSEAYGTTVGLDDIGSGHDPVPLAADLTGLSCGTTYHFRARATNIGGTSNGDDRTFMTEACTGGPQNSLELSNLTIDGDPGEDLYEACIDITAGPNVHVAPTASTLFRASDSVTLKDDFSVGEGSSLIIELAKPAGCP